MGRLGCMRGLLDKYMKELSALPKDRQVAFVEEKVVPLRLSLSRGWEEMMEHLLQTVSTSGEVGTLINLESQTRKTYAFLTKYDRQIASVSGKELPQEVRLADACDIPARLIVLNERTVIEKGEPYEMEVIALGMGTPAEKPVLKYRLLGEKKFKTLAMKEEAGHVFTVRVPEEVDKGTVEWHITAGGDCVYPATAPAINSTWVQLKR